MEYVEHEFEIDPKVLRELKPLTRTSNWAAIKALAFDYAVIAFSIYVTLFVTYWFYPIALILIGSTQRAFVNLLHEAVHGTLATNKLLNFLGGTVLSSYFVFHMFAAYRNSHVGYHHRHFGDEKMDPDYSFHILCGLYETDESHNKFILKNLFLALIGSRTFDYIRYVVRDRILFSADNLIVRVPISVTAERVLFFATWLVVITVITWLGIWIEFLLFWIVPCFTTMVAIGWCTELAEHYPLPQSENKRLLMTRNRHGWSIERFLFGRHDDNYHLVHHIFPTIPFHNLKKAHKILRKDPAYRQWDNVWGGIFTRNRPDQETLMSYVKRYRAERSSLSQKTDGPSFAERFLGHRHKPKEI